MTAATAALHDTFHFHHHKTRSQNKNRILRLLDLDFLHKRTNLVFIGNPGHPKMMSSRRPSTGRMAACDAR